MTSINLVDDLANYLKGKFASWSFTNKNGEEEPVKIFKGFMPEPRGAIVKGRPPRKDGPEDYNSNFPCVVVTFVKTVEGEENTKRLQVPQAQSPTVAEVVLTACSYDRSVIVTGDDGEEKIIYDNHENQGWKDPLLILENIRLWLQTDRNIGHGRQVYYRLLPQLTISNGPIQEFPTYTAEMVLHFEMVRPVQKREWDYDFRPTAKSESSLNNFSEVQQRWQNVK